MEQMSADPENQREHEQGGRAARVRFHVPGGRFGVGLLTLALLVVANNLAVRLTSEPFEAVQRVAREQRPDQELVFLGGGHGTKWLGMTAEGRFRVNGPDGPHELHLVIARSTPFLGWRIVTMSDAPFER